MRNNCEAEDIFMNELTDLMIKHGVVIVSNKDKTFTIISQSGHICIDIIDLYKEKIGAERYE